MIATATLQEEIEPDQEVLGQNDPNRGKFTPTHPCVTTDRPTTQLREARALQRLIFSDAQVIGIKPSDLASLARAWCDLQESIRKLRGIPLPGQLRPDLVPGKRGKREPILNAQSFSEAVEVPKSPDPDPK